MEDNAVSLLIKNEWGKKTVALASCSQSAAAENFSLIYFYRARLRFFFAHQRLKITLTTTHDGAILLRATNCEVKGDEERNSTTKKLCFIFEEARMLLSNKEISTQHESYLAELCNALMEANKSLNESRLTSLKLPKHVAA